MSIDPKKLASYANTRGKAFLPLYAAAAEKHGVPIGLLVAQGAQESGYWDPDVVSGKKVSSAGAMGVGQFMPGTARRFGIDPLDPQQAIDAQAKYVRKNYDLLGGWDKALAGYNWGEGNVQKKGLGNLPAETSDYLRKIMPFVGVGTTRAPSAPSFEASKYAPPKAAESQAPSFDSGKYLPPKPQTTETQAQSFDVSKYMPTKSADTNSAEGKAKQYADEHGVPYEAALRIFQMEAKQNTAIDTEREKLKSSTVFGNEYLGGLVAGVNDAVGSAVDLVTGADSTQSSVADTLDFLHEKSGGAYDVAKFAGQVAPMMAIPVLRAPQAAASKLLPQVAESTLQRGIRYLGNAALQSGGAYAFAPEESRGQAAGVAGAVALGLPVVGKAVSAVGSLGKGVGNFVSKSGQEAAIYSPEVAAGRQLYYGLGAESVNDVARASNQAQTDLASTLSNLATTTGKPLSKSVVEQAERVAIGAPNYLPQTADELGNLTSIARKMLAGTAPLDQFATMQAANSAATQFTNKLPGLSAAARLMPNVAEQYLGRAMAQKLVAAANNPIELSRLLDVAMKQPGWSKFIEASGNAVAGAGQAVKSVGGYMTKYAPPSAALSAGLSN